MAMREAKSSTRWRILGQALRTGAVSVDVSMRFVQAACFAKRGNALPLVIS